MKQIAELFIGIWFFVVLTTATVVATIGIYYLAFPNTVTTEVETTCTEF